MKENCPICYEGNSRTEKWQWGQNEGRHYIFEQESAFTGFELALRQVEIIFAVTKNQTGVRMQEVVCVLAILRGVAGLRGFKLCTLSYIHSSLPPQHSQSSCFHQL